MEEDNAGWEKLLKTLHWLTLGARRSGSAAAAAAAGSDETEMDAQAATALAANGKKKAHF
jgi:hypothetical protein|eukprot:COSAG06_NODE_1917_length_8070_cov_51.606323_6_plen_60_part_00